MYNDISPTNVADLKIKTDGIIEKKSNIKEQD